MAKLTTVKVRKDLTAKKLGVTEEDLAKSEAEIKESLGRTKNVSSNQLTADDVRAKNRIAGKPSDIGEAQALERERLAFEQKLLNATPGQQPGEIPQGNQSQTLQTSGTQGQQQPALSSPAGAVGQIPSETQQIEQQATEQVQNVNTGVLGLALDPLGPISKRAKASVEASPEGSFRKEFNTELAKFVETQRQSAKTAAKNLVGLRIFGIGIGTERESDLKTKLGDSRRILKDNTEAMNDIIESFKKGEISQDEAMIGFLSLKDQILETEAAVQAVSRDPLAFKLGDMEDDLTDFRNWRQFRLPRLQNQLVGGVQVG